MHSLLGSLRLLQNVQVNLVELAVGAVFVDPQHLVVELIEVKQPSGDLFVLRNQLEDFEGSLDDVLFCVVSHAFYDILQQVILENY